MGETELKQRWGERGYGEGDSCEQHVVYQYQTKQDRKRGRVTMAMGSMRLERG
jgi:hypothetical protein